MLSQDEPKQTTARRLSPLSKIPALPGYDWLTVGTLRHYVFAAKTHLDSKGRVIIAGNGLANAIIRIGRRVLIDLDAFDAWVLSHRASGGADA